MFASLRVKRDLTTLCRQIYKSNPSTYPLYYFLKNVGYQLSIIKGKRESDQKSQTATIFFFNFLIFDFCTRLRTTTFCLSMLLSLGNSRFSARVFSLCCYSQARVEHHGEEDQGGWFCFGIYCLAT